MTPYRIAAAICIRCGHALAGRETWPADAWMSALSREEQQGYGYCMACDLFVLRQAAEAEAPERL